MHNDDYISRVELARQLAYEFVQMADEVLKEVKANDSYWFGGKRNAAMNRRGMDLSHALSAIRKGIHR